MVLQIKGQTKRDYQDPNSHFYQSIFVESDSVPDIKMAVSKLKAFYGNDFDEKSISIEEWKGWDAKAMRKGGIKVEKI